VQHAEAAVAVDPGDQPYLDALRAIRAEHRPLLQLDPAAP
jgi:hypothetical protein